MMLGHAVILACGVAWLATLFGLERAVEVGLVPFLFATVLKTALAATSLPAAWQWLQRR
jgi:biotin transport system substrate-specific component